MPIDSSTFERIAASGQPRPKLRPNHVNQFIDALDGTMTGAEATAAQAAVTGGNPGEVYTWDGSGDPVKQVKAEVDIRDYDGSIQGAYDDLPASGGCIVLTPGRYDVGDGVICNRNKPATFRGTGRWARGNPLIAGTELAYDGNDPVIYSSTNAEYLFDTSTPNAYDNGYGFSWRHLVFEFTGSSAIAAIHAPCLSSAVVDDCRLFVTDNAPVDVVMVHAYVDNALGDDASWWRITNNTVSRGALAILGDGTYNANQHLLVGNAGIGQGKTETGALPMIHLLGNTRSVVRDNNVEHYAVGIRFEDCVLCKESGDGGEQVARFLDIDGGARNEVAPLGISSTESSDRLIYLTNSTDNVLILANAANYSTPVEYDAGTSWYYEYQTDIRGRTRTFGGASLFRTGYTSNAIEATGLIKMTGDGGYLQSHLVMGPYHLWVDSTGDLRIKNGVPSSDTDGSVVGTQS